MNKPRIAFMGLGTMGSGMAHRLADAGYSLTVFNRNPERSKSLAAKGARVAGSPREAAEGADVLIAMLSDDAAARGIWLGETGALAGAKKGAIAIDASTLTIACARELAQSAQARGVRFLDAPVTGTKPHAEKGELLFLVGGEQAVLEEARPVLAVMSREIAYLGPAGSGAAMKLINNFLCGVQAAALAEAMEMISATGLAPDKAAQLLLNGAPGSPIVKTIHARQATKDPTVYFQLGLMAKDLSYAVQEARARGIDLATGAAALERFRRASSAGLAERDLATILEPVGNRLAV